ncbi:hypothetical protein QUC31_008123 [Theobroma cacao]
MFSKLVGVIEVNTTEVLVIKESFKLFGVSKWVENQSLIIESDSINVRCVLDSSQAPWRLRKELLSLVGVQIRLGEQQVRKIPRGTNEMANDLTKSSLYSEGDLVLMLD